MTVRSFLIGAAALSAVLLVPVALGADRPDDRAGPLGVGGVAQTETVPFQSFGTADTIVARLEAGLDARGSAVTPVRPDDRAGPLGVGGVAQAETVPFQSFGTADTIVARLEAGLDARGGAVVATRPDDRADRFSPGQVPPAPVRPDDRAERFTPGSEAAPVAAPTATTGFEWSDPLVVGGLAAVIAAAMAVAAFVVVHRYGGGTGTKGPPGTPATTH